MSAKEIMMAAAGASGPPITFVASATNQSTGTAFVINKPTGTVDGDVMIAVITMENNAGTMTPPSGWGTIYNNGANSGDILVFTKVAASEGASYTFTLGAIKTASGGIVSYRNASVGFGGAISTSSTTCVAPQVLMPTTDCLLLGYYGTPVLSATISTPSGMSIVVSDVDATSPSWRLFSQSITASGLTGTRTSTLSSAGLGILFFLTPSSYTVPTPSFIASASTQNTSNTASLIINKPTGTVSGNLMVAFMATNRTSGAAWTPASGWTEIADQVATPNIAIAYKVAGGSEPSTYTFTFSQPSNIVAGSILTYSGAAYDAIGSFATGTSTTTATGPSAALNYSKLIGFCGLTGSGVTVTAESVMTQQVQDSDATSPSYVIADQTVGYGATGNKLFTNNGGAPVSAAIMLTIKPV